MSDDQQTIARRISVDDYQKLSISYTGTQPFPQPTLCFADSIQECANTVTIARKRFPCTALLPDARKSWETYGS